MQEAQDEGTSSSSNAIIAPTATTSDSRGCTLILPSGVSLVGSISRSVSPNVWVISDTEDAERPSKRARLSDQNANKESRKGSEGSRVTNDLLVFLHPKKLVTFRIYDASYSGLYTDFMVHRDSVDHNSVVLKTLFDSGLVRGPNQELTIRKIHPAAFSMFVQWLYQQDWADCRESASSLNVDEWHIVKYWVQLWVFGDRYSIIGLQNKIVETIHSYVSSTLEFSNLESILEYVWESTRPSSKLRGLVLNLAIEYAATEGLDLRSLSMPEEFMIQLLELTLKRLRQNRACNDAGACKLEDFLLPEAKRT